MSLLEATLSFASLAGFIWVTTFLIPKARREDDTFALVCALIAAVVTLIGFFLFGIALKSQQLDCMTARLPDCMTICSRS